MNYCLGLAEETVDLWHLFCSSFHPAFVCNHGVNLLAEVLYIQDNTSASYECKIDSEQESTHEKPSRDPPII